MVVAFLTELRNFLNFKEAICDVNFEAKKPVAEYECHDWENRNALVLPADVKEFYQTTNGFHFSWNNVCGEGKAVVGQIVINSLDCLIETEYVCNRGDGDLNACESAGIMDDLLEPFLLELKQHAGPIRRMFIIERCLGNGYVVLGFQDSGSAIYFIDRDGCIYHLCETLTQYIRLAVAHLGLIDWHVWYTPTAPSNQSMQYTALFVPERIPLANRGMRLGNETDFGAYPLTTINTKKLLSLEENAHDRSNRNAPPGLVNKRGRSTESANHRSGEMNAYVSRKNR
ncbi:hypothetical protein FGIG_05119 [Fasciola gigantica]|uniref:Knr4/Smi1-like domain-containing protein n=1 Tax=Fasciola gigantica TaxID=46835 RepID=A0A504YF26_FASGI|nr:hypothetical protein FGIG_05119 [Fasciola gigantica]